MLIKKFRGLQNKSGYEKLLKKKINNTQSIANSACASVYN